MKEIRSSLTFYGIISFHNTLAVLPTYHKVFSKKNVCVWGEMGVTKHLHKAEYSVLRS